MKIRRRHVLTSLSLTLTVAGVLAPSGPAAANVDDHDGLRSGIVFTSSNTPGNTLLAYTRNADGTLRLHASAATGGVGGGGLGSQGAVTLSGDGRHVFVVNAQSNTVSTFEIGQTVLELRSVVGSGGLHPISVTEKDGLVYVLNDNGSGNVAGFRNVGGTLTPIAGANGALSVNTGAAPAQVGFSTDGDTLVVSEKGTNHLTSYRVARTGLLSAPVVTISPGATPFGFAFDGRNRLVVSEAHGGAAGQSTVSSYRFSSADPARPMVRTASLGNGQSAACWVAITPNGRWAYISNTQSQNISQYDLRGDGSITLAKAAAGLTGPGTTAADSAVSADGRYLHVRSGSTQTIVSFTIQFDGSLSAPATTTGLPTGFVGMAAN